MTGEEVVCTVVAIITTVFAFVGLCDSGFGGMVIGGLMGWFGTMFLMKVIGAFAIIFREGSSWLN